MVLPEIGTKVEFNWALKGNVIVFWSKDSIKIGKKLGVIYQNANVLIQDKFKAELTNSLSYRMLHIVQ